MKLRLSRIYSLLLLPLLFLSRPEVARAADGPLSASRVYEVTRQVDSLIYECLPAGTDVAMYVYDLTDRKPVYSYRADVMCRPASVQKVITSVVALQTLGKSFQFETTLAIRGEIKSDGTLDGDAYLVGGLDPALSEQDLRNMAHDLKSAGVRRVGGTLYADLSMMDSVSWGPGWCWDDAPSSFQPFISPLMVHEGFLQVQVEPSSKGQPAKVNLFPANSFIKVVNHSSSNDSKAGKLKIETDWAHGDNTVTISGNVTRKQSVEISMQPSQWFTLSLFCEYLEQEGITVNHVGYGQCPSIVQTVSVARHGLVPVMTHALKESDNLYAECMFLRMSKSWAAGPVGFSAAADYTKNFIDRKFGMKQASYNIVDGSGLSMYDFMSPVFMVDVLSMLYHKPDLYDLFYNALPVSGVDGTLKTRMSDKGTIGKIHAKTGSVTGASTLAGYIQTQSGHTLAFSIMNGGAVRTSPSRGIQAKLCEVLSTL